MAQTVQVSLQFTANTEQARQQLQSLQQTLNNLGQGTNLNEVGNRLTSSILEAQKAAGNLGIALKNATNTNTGKLNLTQFATQLQKQGKSLGDFRVQLGQLGPTGAQAFQDLTQAVMNAEVQFRNTNKFISSMWVNLKNVAKWQISSAVLTSFTSTFSDAFRYAQDLNESLNNIRIVSGQSTEQMAQFAKEANKAAKALSTTTTEYTDAALIFYQQGLNDEQVKERTDITIKMANASQQSAEIVSDQLTAVWNNFDNGTKSLESYADVMVALGAETASSSEEIATGLEKFAAIAETTGLSFEYASAALATVTATTRQSADVVGTAFKTLFARIQDLEVGKTLEDGTTLGKYSEALNAVGVNIKDANGGLKDMDIILNELAGVWGNLDRDQKAALAQTVAGTRQYTQLMALMENWDFMERNLQTVQDSTGALQEQADIYAESWEAASDRVKASAEGIYDSLIKDDFIIDLTDGFAGFLGLLEKVIDSMGGFKGALSAVYLIFSKIFSQQMQTGIANMAQSLYSYTKAGQAQANALRTSAASEGILALEQGLQTGGYVSPADEQRAKNLRNEYELQKQILSVAERLTNEEKEQAQYYFQIIKNAGENLALQKEELQTEEETLGRLKQQARSQTGNISMSFARSTIGNKPEDMESYAQRLNHWYGLDVELGRQLYQQQDRVTEATKNTEKAAKGYNDAIEGGFKTEQFRLSNFELLSQSILKSFNAVSQLTMGLSSLTAGLKTLQDPDLSAWDKFTSTMMSFSMAIPMIISSMSSLGQVYATFLAMRHASIGLTGEETAAELRAITVKGISESLSKKGVKSKLAEAAASQIKTFENGKETASTWALVQALWAQAAAWVAANPIMATAIAIAGGLTIAAVVLSSKYETLEEKTKRVNEEHKNLKTGLEEVNKVQEELNSHLSNYDELVNKLNKITKGTQEWHSALTDVNKSILDLIEKYPDLANNKYIQKNIDGVRELTKAGKEFLNQKLAEAELNLTIATSAKSIQLEELNIQQKIQETVGTFDAYNPNNINLREDFDKTKWSSFEWGYIRSNLEKIGFEKLGNMTNEEMVQAIKEQNLEYTNTAGQIVQISEENIKGYVDTLGNDIREFGQEISSDYELSTQKLIINYEEIGRQIRENVKDDSKENTDALVGAYANQFVKSQQVDRYEKYVRKYTNEDNKEAARQLTEDYLEAQGINFQSGSLKYDTSGAEKLGEERWSYIDKDGNPKYISTGTMADYEIAQKANQEAQNFVNSQGYQDIIKSGYAEVINDLIGDKKISTENIDTAIELQKKTEEDLQKLFGEGYEEIKKIFSAENPEGDFSLSSLISGQAETTNQAFQKQFTQISDKEELDSITEKYKNLTQAQKNYIKNIDLSKVTSEEAFDKIVEEAKAAEQATKKMEFFEGLKSAEDDLDGLSKALKELDEDGKVSGTTFAGLEEKFSQYTNEWNNFVNAEGAEAQKKALDELAGAYLQQSGLLDKVGASYRNVAIEELKSLGFKNAETIVNDKLKKQLYELALNTDNLITKEGELNSQFVRTAKEAGFLDSEIEEIKTITNQTNSETATYIQTLLDEGIIGAETATKLLTLKISMIDVNDAAQTADLSSLIQQMIDLGYYADNASAALAAAASLSSVININEKTGKVTWSEDWLKTLSVTKQNDGFAYVGTEKFEDPGKWAAAKSKSIKDQALEELRKKPEDEKYTGPKTPYTGNEDDKKDKSGKDKSGKDKEEKTPEISHYETINKALEYNNKLREKNNKLLENTKNQQERLEFLEKELELLKTEEELLDIQWKEANKELQLNKEALNNSGLILHWDGDRLVNYDEVLTQLSAIKTAAENTEDKADDKVAEELQRLYDGYVEAWDKRLEVEGKRLENLNEQENSKLKSIIEKFEPNREKAQRELDLIDFRIDINEDDLNGLVEDYALLTEKTGLFGTQMQSINDQLHETALRWDELDPEERASQIESLGSSAQEVAQSAKELRESWIASYGEALDKGLEKISKTTDQFENLNSALEHYKSLMDLLGRGQNYRQIDKILQGQSTVLKDQMTSSKTTYDMLRGQMDYWETQLANAVTESEKEAIQTQIDAITPELASAYEEWLSLGEEYAQNLQDILTNSLSAAAKELEDALTGDLGFDLLQSKIEALQAEDEVYLTETNQAYETNKLIRQAQIDIDKSTNKLHQDMLKKFQQETKVLQEQKQLSKDELEIQQLKYNLLVAQIALEDARDAKNQVRLMRDSQGNFNYVYTADQNAISEAEQAYADADNELYNKYLEVTNSNASLIQQIQQEFAQEAAGLDPTDPDYLDKLADLQKRALDKIKMYYEQYSIGIEGLGDRASEAWTQNIMKNIDSVRQFRQDSEQYIDEVTDAYNEHADKIEDLTTELDLNYSGTAKKIGEVTEKSNELKDTVTANKTLVEKALTDQANALVDWMKENDSVIDSLIQRALKYSSLVNALQNIDGGYHAIMKQAADKKDRELFEMAANLRRMKVDATGNDYGRSTDDIYNELKWFNTGGYTGSWNGDSGRLAVLHEKELVLNQTDTANILSAVDIVRKVLDVISLQNIASRYSLSNISQSALGAAATKIDQQVQITAEFPNATDKNEIKAAFDDIINEAVQYAGIRRV